MLREPLLYLSLYFKQHRQTYYELLQAVRETGAWEQWLAVFLRGIVVTAGQAIATAPASSSCTPRDRDRIEGLGRPAATALRVHQLSQRKALVTIPTPHANWPYPNPPLPVPRTT